ncbi:MAG: hypothetical protein DRR06_13185 [Gammaproteobacteria bacterium]|nr:MAG: hypothetical protein DRR06_13185 [Gammaproteobacteria bacterium]
MPSQATKTDVEYAKSYPPVWPNLYPHTKREETRIHFKLDCQQIKLSIGAPRSVKILRGELLERSCLDGREPD